MATFSPAASSRRARSRPTRTTSITFIGFVMAAASFGSTLTMSGIVKTLPKEQALAAMTPIFERAAPSNLFFALTIGTLVGPLVLSIGLFVKRIIPRWSSALLILAYLVFTVFIEIDLIMFGASLMILVALAPTAFRLVAGNAEQLAGRQRIVPALALVCAMLPGSATAQTTAGPSRSSTGVVVRWTSAGVGIGVGVGAYLGMVLFDDAVNSDRKFWTSAVVGGIAGGVGGYLIGRHRTRRAVPAARVDPPGAISVDSRPRLWRRRRLVSAPR